MMPDLASQMRMAFASIAWKTGSSSPGELLITPRTSDVAFCCSSNSVSSRVRASSSLNSRVFSMAITAWSAKVRSSATCASVNGRFSMRRRPITPMASPRRSMGMASTVR